MPAATHAGGFTLVQDDQQLVWHFLQLMPDRFKARTELLIGVEIVAVVLSGREGSVWPERGQPEAHYTTSDF